MKEFLLIVVIVILMNTKKQISKESLFKFRYVNGLF